MPNQFSPDRKISKYGTGAEDHSKFIRTDFIVKVPKMAAADWFCLSECELCIREKDLNAVVISIQYRAKLERYLIEQINALFSYTIYITGYTNT